MRRIRGFRGLCLLVVLLAGSFFGGAAAVDELFDTYGPIPWEEEALRLDNFAVYLKRNPDMVGYAAFFHGPGADMPEFEKRLERVKKHLFETRGLDAGRVVIMVKAGGKEVSKTILQPVSKDLPPPDLAAIVSEQ